MSAIFMGSFPVFLGPVSRDLAWGQAVFPQVITVVSVCSALLMPLTGRLIDRIGVRWPVAIGLALVALGMTLLSGVRQADGLFWIAAISLGMGASLSGPPAFVGLMSSWYTGNRALALSIVLSLAPMCSQAAVAPAVQRLITTMGWREAYRILAGVVLVLGLFASLTSLRPNPTAVAPAPDRVKGTPRHAVRTGTFWLLAAASCFSSGPLIGFSVHTVGWLTSRGVSPETASTILSALFLSGVAGALLSGSAVDRTQSLRVVQIFFALPLLGLALMASTTATPLLLAGAALIGFGMSASTGLCPFLVTRYFGLKGPAEIFGFILALTMVAIGVAPVLIGLGFDSTGSYADPIAAVAVAVAFSTLCIGLLDRVGITKGKAGAESQIPPLASGGRQ
ncbi:MFS transporter [Nitrospirillum viridazoti]|nr:MFS transporter [Nitrospirillum amazonense]